MAKGYGSIFEKLIEEMEGQGQKHYRMTLDQDRAVFNLPPEMKPPTKGLQDSRIAPMGGEPIWKPNTRVPGGGDGKTDKQLRLPASSTIQSAAYFPNKEYLLVGFKSGHTYSYEGVPIETVLAWQQAPSAGSWFYYNIRMNFRYQKQ